MHKHAFGGVWQSLSIIIILLIIIIIIMHLRSGECRANSDAKFRHTEISMTVAVNFNSKSRFRHGSNKL